MAATPWTAEWLQKVFLFGVDLTDDDGNPYPDELWDQALAAAREWLATQLDITIPRVVVGGGDPGDPQAERHDFSTVQFGEWWFMNVDRRPVHEIVEVKFKFGNQDVLTVPTSWFQQPDPLTGQLQLVPDPGELITWPLAQMSFYGAQTLSMYGKLPGWYQVKYSAGYNTSELPADLLDLGGKYASMYPLNTAGDLIVGAGIASKSVSMDGVSESVGTTSSATNAGYGARILQYRKDIDRDLPAIKRRYHGMPIRVT